MVDLAANIIHRVFYYPLKLHDHQIPEEGEKKIVRNGQEASRRL